MSHGSGLCLSERGALILSRVPQPAIKKCLAALGTQLALRIFKARSCVTEAPADVQAVTVRPHSAASAQLITHVHCYSCDMTRHDVTTRRARFSAAE
jgi:hypothetical protein